MAFVPITYGRGPVTVQESRIKVYHSAKSKSRQLIINMSRSIAEKMNWQAKDRMLISLGVGEDYGRLTVVKIKKGGQQLSTYINQKPAYCIGVTIPRDGVDGRSAEEFFAGFPSATVCEFTISPNGLLITIPPLREAARATLRAVS